MNNILLRFLFSAFLVLIFPFVLFARTPLVIHSHFVGMSLIDSTVRQKTGTTGAREKDEQKGDIKREEIKEVPKAKRKEKPAAIKTRIKIPVKRVKPTIKRLSLGRKMSGI